MNARRNLSATMTPIGRLLRRLAIGVAVLLLVAFALGGGEYGLWDVRDRVDRRTALELEVKALTQEADSLVTELVRVQSDNATIERVAREEFGMVRGDKEVLYRFAESEDSLP